MRIELKSLKIYEAMSEETIAFTADVFIEGKKVAYAKNDGHGGSTYYHSYPNANRDILAAAEKYCEGLPKDKHGFSQSLESVIDEWVYRVYNEKENAKHQKKLEKNCLKGICFGTPDSYQIFSWTGWELKDLLTTLYGRSIIKEKIKQLKSEGQQILNTNIPADLL